MLLKTCKSENRIGIGSERPLDPGPQHKGDFTKAFRLLLPSVWVTRLYKPSFIVPAYEVALRYNGPSIIIEHADLYHEDQTG